MFQEQIGKHMADHLREHISGYLGRVDAFFGDNFLTVVPKQIEPASVVGGIYKDYDKIMPQYGIDINDKVFSQVSDDLFVFQYSGQLNGMVHGGSRDAVDTSVKRHAAACELFIKEHQFFHQYGTDEFNTFELAYVDTAFSGAEDLEEPDGKPLWIAAFSLDFLWWLSEDGPNQHAT